MIGFRCRRLNPKLCWKVHFPPSPAFSTTAFIVCLTLPSIPSLVAPRTPFLVFLHLLWKFLFGDYLCTLLLRKFLVSTYYIPNKVEMRKKLKRKSIPKWSIKRSPVLQLGAAIWESLDEGILFMAFPQEYCGIWRTGAHRILKSSLCSFALIRLRIWIRPFRKTD